MVLVQKHFQALVVVVAVERKMLLGVAEVEDL
jgi:hypothetical protein